LDLCCGDGCEDTSPCSCAAEIHAYADRIIIRQSGAEIREHERCFGRGETIYNPSHYVPILARKPGTLRNGTPFHNWVLPTAMEKVRRRLSPCTTAIGRWCQSSDCVGIDGLSAAAAIINILVRKRDPQPATILSIPDALRLTHEPMADCARSTA